MAQSLLSSLPPSLQSMADILFSLQGQVAQALDPTNGVVGSLLTQSHTFWLSLPTLYILIGHCAMCTTLAPEAKKHFLLHYWLTFLGGFAGGPLSALLIMNPAKAPISLLGSNKSGITWTLVWWFMTYSPIAPLLNYVYNFKPVKVFCKSSVSYLRATLIISRVTLVSQLYPGVLLGPIITATVSSCGGKATYDAIRHIYGLNSAPAEFTVPSYSFRSAFLGSALFFLSSINPTTRFITPEQGAGALISLFVFHSLITEIFGITFDWTAALLSVILRIANIPWPEGIPQPLPSIPAANKPTAPSKSANKQPTQPSKQSKEPASHNTQAARHTSPSSNGSLTAVSVDTTGAGNGELMSYAITADDSSYEAGVGENGTLANGLVQGLDADGDPASKVSADVIREALRKSAKAGKTASKGQGGNGWQVVTGRKKPQAAVETKKGK